MLEPTKGPWRYERIGSARSVKEDGMAFRIVAPEVGDIRQRDVGLLYYKPSLDEAEDNARLIVHVSEVLEENRKLRDQNLLLRRALEGHINHSLGILRRIDGPEKAV